MTDRPTETKDGIKRRRTAPEGECCFCHEPKEDHPIEAGSNSTVGNYTDHEYVSRYDGHGANIEEYIEVECPWCGSTDASAGAHARGEPTIYCPDCNTSFR